MYNGVYILKCKDQYRVRVIADITPLSHEQTVELFSECRFTRNKMMALYIASQLYNSLNEVGCFYGIQFINVNTTWAKLVAASQPAPQEEVSEIAPDTTEVADESAV